MTRIVTETFFLPDETGREATRIPADLYNLAHTLLARSESGCVFVPIRTLQYLGVITDTEIVFVDSMAYACSEEQGGRMVMLAWQFRERASRDSLREPVACEVLYYGPQGPEVQMRLVAEFAAALQLLDRRYRDRALPAGGASILKLKQS